MSEHRETATAAMDQAILCLAGDSAADRVEWNILFLEHLALPARCSGKRYQYHAAAGFAGVRVWHQAGIGRTA